MAAWSLAREGSQIRISGELRMRDARTIWRALQAASRDVRAGDVLDLDLSSVIAADGMTIPLLVELRNALVLRGVRSEIVGTPEHLHPLVELYRDHETPPLEQPRPRGWMAELGSASRRLVARARGSVAFVGELAYAIVHSTRRRRDGTLRAVSALLIRAGADGVPIVLLLNFLVGFVIAFQTMRQLQQYGANIYVADIVGVSVTRELVPLMTAVIISGRSGAAFAAELGTMRVNEEIDALRTMGISPIRSLVLPRVIALVIAAPVLTLLGDVVAIGGGLAVAVASLGLTVESYLGELRIAVVPSDVWTGLLKSIAFGATIALVGCHQGLATTGSAEGVGRRTTSTVVICLFMIVVFDTILTILFRTVGV